MFRGIWRPTKSRIQAIERCNDWVSPALVKAKLFGFNKVSILCHRKEENGVSLLLELSEGQKLVTVDRPDSYWRELMTSFGVNDYPDLYGKKLLVSFKIVCEGVCVDKIKVPDCATNDKKRIAS